MLSLNVPWHEWARNIREFWRPEDTANAMGRCLSSKDARAPYTLVVRAPGKGHHMPYTDKYLVHFLASCMLMHETCCASAVQTRILVTMGFSKCHQISQLLICEKGPSQFTPMELSSNGHPQALTDVTLLQFPPSSIWYGSSTNLCVGTRIQNRRQDSRSDLDSHVKWSIGP